MDSSVIHIISKVRMQLSYLGNGNDLINTSAGISSAALCVLYLDVGPLDCFADKVMAYFDVFSA